MPSDYHSLIRAHTSMQDAVKIERKLREGQAQEALDSFKTHLMTYQSLKARKANVSGVVANTAQDRRAQGKTEAINKAKARYREVHSILRVLGMPEDHAKFKPLADADCKFVILTVERKAQDSTRLPTWIWGDSRHIRRHPKGAIKDFMKHCESGVHNSVVTTHDVYSGMKAHWFRHCALRDRWREEQLLCREEMYRTVRFFEYGMEDWTRRAAVLEAQGRTGAATYARR